MGWFRRHLNLTALIISLIATGLVLLLIQVSFGFYAVDYLSRLNLAIIFANIGAGLLLAITGFGWVLRRKNRRLYWLLFFAPLLCPLLLPFIPHGLSDGTSFALAFFSCLFAIPGWIIVLILRTKRKTTEPSLAGLVQPKSRGRSALFQWTIIGVLVIAVAWVGIAGYSGYQWSYGYQRIQVQRNNGQTWFTMELPKSYSTRNYFNAIILEADSGTTRISMQETPSVWFFDSSPYSRIEITISNPIIFNYLRYESQETKTRAYLLSNLTGYSPGISFSMNILNSSGITVDGVMADYTGYDVENSYVPSNIDPGGMVEAVSFERDGLIWVISSCRSGEKELGTDPVFDRLIQSFDIVEE